MTEKDTQKTMDAYDYLTNAASPQECTGLIPSAPESKAELQSYEDIYHYEPPKITVQKKSSSK